MRAPRPSCGPRSSGCASSTDLRLSDFGTRRRHGFLWQRWCVEAVKEGLGPSFTGTSNVLLAMDNDLEAIGTNAHELPMVAAALAKDDEELRWAPYRILDQWRQTYGGNLLIVLPDAFGTKAFLRDAPDWVADWTGFRPDSAPPIEAGEEIIAWWKQKGRDPREKLLVFSDAMDVGSIEETYHRFSGRVRLSLRLGHQPHQRFRRLHAGRIGQSRSDLDRLQGHLGRRTARRETLRQPGKGDRQSGGDRALSARVRRCGARPHCRRGVSGYKLGCPSKNAPARNSDLLRRYGLGSHRAARCLITAKFSIHGSPSRRIEA